MVAWRVPAMIANDGQAANTSCSRGARGTGYVTDGRTAAAVSATSAAMATAASTPGFGTGDRYCDGKSNRESCDCRSR